LHVAAGTEDEILKEMAQKSEKVLIYTEGKEVKKVIVIPGRLVNIVIAG
jgi:leucyl-tRNA synthetase